MIEAERKLVGTDIDDCLAENARGFIKFSNREFGTKLDVQDYQEDWVAMWRVDVAEAERRAEVFYKAEVFGEYEYIRESDVAIKAIGESFRLSTITSRRLCIADCTKSWLVSGYGDVFESNHFAGIYDSGDPDAHKRSKIDILREVSPDYYIDDQIKHCLASAVMLDKDTILFGNYHWNQTDDLPPNVTRCVNWSAVLDYFDERGELVAA